MAASTPGWCSSLAGVTRPELVLAGIARAVGAELGGTSSLLEALAEQLGDGHWLLVLDNLEQVLQVAGDLQELLARCPGVTILATSRTVMGLGAEQEGLPLAIELAAARPRLLDPRRYSAGWPARWTRWGPAPSTCPNANAPWEPPSPGASPCSRTMSGRYWKPWPCSSTAGRSKRPPMSPASMRTAPST